MLVRILKTTDYTPTADDSPRCWGQLRHRADETLGKMVTCFHKGATPELKDEVAQRLIDEGVAESAGESPVFVTREQIWNMVTG